MDIALYLISFIAALAFGYVLGRWNGYLDALPKRDAHGRFIKKD